MFCSFLLLGQDRPDIVCHACLEDTSDLGQCARCVVFDNLWINVFCLQKKKNNNLFFGAVFLGLGFEFVERFGKR